MKDWFEGIRDTATPDRLRPAGNRTGRKKKLFWAGMSGDGEKNNWFGAQTSPHLVVFMRLHPSHLSQPRQMGPG